MAVLLREKFFRKNRKKCLTKRPTSSIMCHVAEVHSTKANGSIAQLGEHLPYKQEVTGSSPVVPTIHLALWCSRLARQPVTLEVDGSSPFGVAIKSQICA